MAQPDTQQPGFSDMPPEPPPSARVPRSRRAQLPWMWLAVGFVVILALGAVVYLISGSGAAQPVIIAEPTVTATTAGQPTATPRELPPTSTPSTEPETAQPESSSGSEGVIELGIEVEVTGTGINGLSLRSGPGTNYARLRTASDGEVLTVVDGPQEANGYEWWQVRDDQGNEGWGVGEWLRPTGE